MCGIIGIFNNKNAPSLIKKGLSYMKNRGRDGCGIASIDKCRYVDSGIQTDSLVGHCLHSVVSSIAQPLIGKGTLVANCEIFNWQELNKKHKLGAKNDADMLLKLFDTTGEVCDSVPMLDGDYAFAYWKDKKVILARDIVGIKPIFYSHAAGFSFASEKKVLENLGFTDIHELNPRKFLTYDTEHDRVYFTNRKFFTIEPENKGTAVKKYLINAVEKRVPNQKLGLLFSGGVDSSVLALILKNLGVEFTCYTAVLDQPGMSDAEDLVYAKKVAQSLGLKLKIKRLRLTDIPKYLKKIIPIIEDTNVTKVGVALTFYPALELAKKDGVKVIFSGLGSEEIFAGYQRHKNSTSINQECLSGLLKMYERDTYRDDTISMANSIEQRVPYLDQQLINYALKIPSKMKINDNTEKLVLRQLAVKLGLPEEFAYRKKRAAQYGSKMHRALEKLTRRNKFKLKSEYLRQFYPQHNLNLAALASGGKDSLYAMHVMQRQNYRISCLVTLKSENPDSYMFHTPAIDMVDLQAQSMGIPLIIQTTKGEKEKELADLKKALTKAKQQYRIQGVVTGALYSNYQRTRVEKICDELGLKIFSPLWHLNQETEMKEILDAGFSFIFTRVAAEGLDKTWLGRPITYRDITKLARLNKKIGLNIAGEGGEFESLVIEAPIFSKTINVKGKINMENNYTGIYQVQQADSNEKEKN